jgi:hypothetical protein
MLLPSPLPSPYARSSSRLQTAAHGPPATTCRLLLSALRAQYITRAKSAHNVRVELRAPASRIW